MSKVTILTKPNRIVIASKGVQGPPGPEGQQGIQGPNGDTGDVTPEALAARDAAQEAASSAQDDALAAAGSAAAADGAAQARVQELRDDLADPAGGAGLVAFRQEGAGATNRTLAGKLAEFVSVRDYGAAGDGVTDDSVAIENAIHAVAAAGGGVVYWPSGEYCAIDLPVVDGVRHVGCGWSRSVVRPPVGVTSGSIFRYKGTGNVDSADWSYMTISGGAKPVADWSDMDLGFLSASPSMDYTARIQRWFGDPTGIVGIDMRGCAKWEEGTSIGLFVTKCWRGISGSQNDRKANFISCRLHGNFAGYYAQNNHSHWLMCDFRDNNIGLLSRGGYDQQFTHCTWVTNGFGILPDVLHTNGGRISQSYFSNCYIFNNEYGGAVVNSRVQFHACLLVHGTLGKVGSFGIRFNGRNCQWNGGNVRGEGTAGFDDCAFIVSVQPGDIISDVRITNVSLFTGNVTRIDFGLGTSAAQISFTGNYGFVRGYVFKSEVGKQLNASHITGNDISVVPGSTLLAGEAFIDIPQTTTASVGNMVANNTLRDQSSSPAFGFRIDANSSVVSANIANLPYQELSRNALTRVVGNRFPDDAAEWRNPLHFTSEISPGTIPPGTAWTATRAASGLQKGRPLAVGYSQEIGACFLSVEAQSGGYRVKILNPTDAPVAVPDGTITVVSV